MPKVEMFDKNQALMSALNLFWEKGYEATSLADLTKELGIGKGSFYNTFGSKKQLFENCLEAYRSNASVVLNEVLKDKSDPIGGLENFLNFHTETMLNDPSSRGCLIANSSTELSYDPDIQKFLSDHNSWMRAKLLDYIKGSSLEDKGTGLVDSILIYVTGVSVISKFNNGAAMFKESNQSFVKSFK